MLVNAWRGITLAVFGFTLIHSTAGPALTLDTLQRDAALSPHSFARHFATFRFRFHAEVQRPEVFLARRSGDCDDYATLAAALLKKRGYTPRLISVRMKREVHVVCYVEEARAYLDYNKRSSGDGLVRCGSSLRAIADKVAASFDAKWTSVSEFTFRDGLKRMVQTALPGSLEPAIAGSTRADSSWTAAGLVERR